MKTRLSVLLDGELPGHDAQTVIDNLKCDEALRARWQEYLLIRDALKGRKSLDTDITSRVMASLKDEPVVLAPRLPTPRPAWQSSALALAATLAGVAVVAWLALGTGQAPKQVAALARHEPAVVAQAPAVRRASRDMQEYFVAHQAQSSSLQFRGVTDNIRTVAIADMAPAK